MKNLLKIYGNCIITKDTLFFRSDSIFDESAIFFAHTVSSADNFNRDNTRKIQIWKATKDFEILFMITKINIENNDINSALKEIYNYYFPNEVFVDDLDVKYFDRNKRYKFIQKLLLNNINGWLSPIEKKVDTEICLFNQNNIELISCKEVDNINRQYNSLMHLNINPSKEFYEKSNIKTNEGYKTHLKWYKSTVKNAKDYEENSRFFKYDYYDLRLKLKI